MIEWTAVWLTVQLAAATTLLLAVIGLPIAWWLANHQGAGRPIVEAVVAMPLVLPPTVLGFYLLLLFNPNATIGKFWFDLTGTTLTFSFSGLVAASMLYSLPFMVQPLQSAFERVGREPLEAAATLGAGAWDRFISVVLPQSRRGCITAAVLTFAHTVGEFGVVLMVGGNIPGETRVMSIAIYEHVETLDYASAHWLAGLLLLFSFIVLLSVYVSNRRAALRIA